MSHINILKDVWYSLYDPKIDVIKTIEKFFHPDYEQCINGVCMNRAEYIQHVFEQKKNMIINNIEYRNIIEKGDELFSIYYPKGLNKNNSPVEAEVIAYFHFKDEKIYRIHGQVRLIKGDLSDADMKNS